MRPEIVPHLLEFSVPAWTVILCLASVAMGLYNGWTILRRQGQLPGEDDAAAAAEARKAALTQAATWGIGGVAATLWWIVPNVIAPEAAKHGGLYDLPLHTYGFAIALGFMFAISLSAREAARSGIFPGEIPPRTDAARERARSAVLDLAFYVLIAAIVGSRIYFIAVNWSGPEGYGAHPENIVKFWTGGLVFYGGFLGSIAASIAYAWRYKINFLKLADLAIPTVSLGQFFGRLGCFAAGCCFGREIGPQGPALLGVRFPQGSLAWDTLVNQRHTLAATELHTPALYPSQLIDGGGQLLIFFFLTFFLKPRKRFDGQILLTWLFLYPLLRFFDEFLRGDTERGVYTALHVSAGQLTSLLLMGVALGLLIWTHRRNPRQAEPGGGIGGQPVAA